MELAMQSPDKAPPNEAMDAQLAPGFRFSTCAGGDGEDQDVVTVLDVTRTHVLLESSGDLNGWRPIGLIAEAIAEASGQRSLRKLR